MYSHLQKDYDNLKRYLPEIDKAPQAAQDVAFDIQYNPGGLNKQNWPNLFKAINNRDINGIANNVLRKDIGDNRNNWATKQIHSITNW